MAFVFIILVATVLAGVLTVGTIQMIEREENKLQEQSNPGYKLRKRYNDVRTLILEEVEQKGEAVILLDDCEEFLDSILLAYERLETLQVMAEEAQELVDAPNFIGREHEELESKITESLEMFMRKLYQISTEITYDRTGALDRLSSFSEDISEYRQALEAVQKDIVFESLSTEIDLVSQKETEKVGA